MIYLREISADDLQIINQWRNDKGLIDLLGSPFRYINHETDKRWFESYLANRNTNVRCAIVDKESNAIIGLVNLTNIDWSCRGAEFSIMIGNSNFYSKGIGKMATIEMLKHGFNNLNLHRIYLTVLTYNDIALKLYKSIGFEQEGIIRDAVFKQGKYQDAYMMSILEDEFKF